MIYALLPFLLTALVTLIVVGYRRPEILASPAFPFTRKCLGVAILAYGAAVIAWQCVPLEAEGMLMFAALAQIPAWVGIIFVFRGIFELLSCR